MGKHDVAIARLREEARHCVGEAETIEAFAARSEASAVERRIEGAALRAKGADLAASADALETAP